MDIQEYLTEKIKVMTQKKGDNHIVPNHVLSNELYNAIIVDVKSTLNKMTKEKIITVCKTLNNLGIKLK